MITTIIDGKIYDITDFVNVHPGGREMIRLAENRDSTYLFWSYHIDRKKANKYLS
jgi:cytochrome b involved in lipid metabolism